MSMKIKSSRRGDASLVDLLVIILAVGIVAAIFLPMLAKSRAKASRINCVNNLKQISLSFRLWAGDNNDKYPAQVSTNAGGAMELVAAGSLVELFGVMSNELSTPKILLCPWDSQRTQAIHFSNLSNTNISYFTVLEASETIPEMWLSGDRNLATSQLPLWPGLFWLPTNRVTSWTSQIHSNQGNIVFANGSVQQFTSAKLHSSATNALRAYREATTNVSFRLAIP